MITRETENHEEDETMNIKVNQISEKTDRISPIVAYFSSGYDPCSENQKSDYRVTVYKHKDKSKKRLQVVVSPIGSTVEFVGSNCTGEQATRQTCMYTLGVLDKETQTLKILPIAHNKIFRLEPRVKPEEASTSELITELSEGQLREKKEELTELYGTQKVINKDKKKRALYLGDDHEALKVLDEKLNEVYVKKKTLDENKNSTIARNIPPYDASATNPSKAYPIEKIIAKGEWKFLQDIYLLLQQETGVGATNAYPSFVQNRLYRLRDMKDETEKQKVSCVLSLLTHFVKFKDMNSMVGFDSAKDHRFPGIIRQKCKSLFKDHESDKIPIDKINLLIRYVLVLSLHVDKFKTDPEDIAKDLRVSKVDVRKQFVNLGCKFERDKTVLLATLPVPLEFPQVMRKRRR